MSQEAEIVREAPKSESPGFGSMLPAPAHETSIASAAAQAKAQVEARFLMALHRPRDIDETRERILRSCRRPGFAETARYRKPIGKGIEGLSIRFAEMAIQAMRNIDVQAPTLYEDSEKRIRRVMVTDLESNTTYSTDITINKTVERRALKEGQVALGSRQNSSGNMVYLVEATEDDLLNKEGALASKAIRTSGLRLLPADIKEEAERLIIETLRNKDAEDPDAARKKILDAFAEVGVAPADVKKYLGHDIGHDAADLNELRAVYAAIRDGEASWADTLRARQEERKGQGSGRKPSDSRAENVKSAVKEKASASGPPADPVTDWKGKPDSPRLTEAHMGQLRAKANSRAIALAIDGLEGGGILSLLLAVGGCDELAEVADALFDALAVCVEEYQCPGEGE